MKAPSLLDREQFLTSVVLLVVMVLLSGGMGVFVLTDKGIADAYVLARAVGFIARSADTALIPADVTASARAAMFGLLDRYSGYIDRKSFERIDEELSGSYSGIGVTVVGHDDGLLVLAVQEDGPAAKAGFLPGDIIVGADSVGFSRISSDSAAAVLRGKEGSSVLVWLFRQATADTIKMDIFRQGISFVHIPYAGFTDDSLVYVRIADFESGTSSDLQAVLDSLVGSDLARAKGLILDLRGNPGGLLQEACRVANLFLQDGAFIVGTDSRSIWDERRYYATGEDIVRGVPLAVLVDRGSASSAEIVAGALRQAGRAILVGDTTYGKGLVQRLIRYVDGDGIRLTIARYYLEGGVYINRPVPTVTDSGDGLVPDHYFELEKSDPFLQALERSFLCFSFAAQFQDEIVAGELDERTDIGWIGRFAAFCRAQGFDFESDRTHVAKRLLSDVDDGDYSVRLRESVVRIEEASRRIDQQEFERHEDHIMRRLKQIAVERAHGRHRAYQDVILPADQAIAAAADLLLRGR